MYSVQVCLITLKGKGYMYLLLGPLTVHCMEGNFAGGKVWRIAYQFVIGKINFGELLKAHSTGTWHFNKVKKLVNSNFPNP